MVDFAGLHRRDVLQRAMLLAGLAIMPGGAIAATGTSGQAAVLTAPDRALLKAIADTIIPQTDTPGALAVGVPALFEDLLAEWASVEHRAMLITAMQRIDATTLASAGLSFVALPAARRQEVLTRIDSANAMTDMGYARLKELIVALYYLSEPGSTVELRYEHAPGSWDPSLPVTPEARTQGGAAML